MKKIFFSLFIVAFFINVMIAQSGAWISHTPPIPVNGTWHSDAGDDCLGCVPQNSQYIFFFDINSSQWVEINLGSQQFFNGLDANGHTIIAYSNELLVGYSATLSQFDTISYEGTPLTPNQNGIYRSWGSGRNLGYFVTDTHIYVFDSEEAIWKSMDYNLPSGYYGVGFYWVEDDYLGALLIQPPPALNTALVYSLQTHSFNHLEEAGDYNHNNCGMTHGFVTKWTDGTLNRLHAYSAITNEFIEKIVNGYLLNGNASRQSREKMVEKTATTFHYTEIISSSLRREHLLGYDTRNGLWIESFFDFDPTQWGGFVTFNHGGQFSESHQLNINTQQTRFIIFNGSTGNFEILLSPLYGLIGIIHGGTVFIAADENHFYFYSVTSGNSQLCEKRWQSNTYHPGDNFIYAGTYAQGISDSLDGYFYNGNTNNLIHIVTWNTNQFFGNPYYSAFPTGGPGNHVIYYSGLVDGLSTQSFQQGVYTGIYLSKNLAFTSTASLSCIYEASTNSILTKNYQLSGSLGDHSILTKSDSHNMDAYSCETGNWSNFNIGENILNCYTSDRVGLGHCRDAHWTDIYYAYNSYSDNIVELNPNGLAQNYGDDVGGKTILVLQDSAMYAFDPFAASGTTTSQVFMEYSINLPIQDLLETEHSIWVDFPYAPSSSQSLIGIDVIIDTVLHSAVGDLEIIIKHNGVSDTLVYRVGENGDNFFNTELSDAANLLITNGTAPFSGRYKPYKPLSVFSGIDPSGEWTLSIYDALVGNTGTLEAWGIKLFFDSATEIKTDEISNVTTYKLHQNYPNPFNPSTKISWQSPVGSRQTLKVYDVLGNEVATLVDEYKPAGIYEVEFQSVVGNRQLASGIYLYRLQAGSFVETRKMILLK
jgi:hypothetical protein